MLWPLVSFTPYAVQLRYDNADMAKKLDRNAIVGAVADLLDRVGTRIRADSPQLGRQASGMSCAYQAIECFAPRRPMHGAKSGFRIRSAQRAVCRNPTNRIQAYDVG